jgi:ABC-type uncharacterized transport system ATPase subunit
LTLRKPPLLEACSLHKSFGSLHVLRDVSLTVRPGTFHAIVGENGAGKSTLAKCILGFHHPDGGQVRLDGESAASTAATRRAGAGMVFQHFTLASSMTVAENLVLARPDLPPLIRWRSELAAIREFLRHAPFQVDLASRVEHLAAGQKQKVEILKQLYLETRLLILDEPTSVLTPAEANEVLGVLSSLVKRGALSVILITHKLREVMEYADEVTVLRRGLRVVSTPCRETSVPLLAKAMIGDAPLAEHTERTKSISSKSALEIRNVVVRGDNGLVAVNDLSLTLRDGEILGIAGISGNGQRELVQAVGGQRDIENGEVLVSGKRCRPSREFLRRAGLFTLPEEPLENAAVGSMSVAENLVLRTFDVPPFVRSRFLLDRTSILQAAREAIRKFSIRTPSPETPLRNLSGGNVQRAVLARDLGGGNARVLVVANPCFGLDFAAAAFVHHHLLDLRNRGGAVLLISEDLDELSKLADRIVVMSAGVIVHETSRADLDLAVVGRHMGAHAAA